MKDTSTWRWTDGGRASTAGPESLVPPTRLHLLDEYAQLLTAANKRINLVSRSASLEIRSHHIPHCLTICSRGFPSNSLVVDVGTGGGLPAVPLAIAFPDVQFVGIDSTGKKVALLRVMARKLGLQNLDVWYGRAEDWDGQATHVVSRATAPLRKLWQWTRRCVAWDSGATPGDSDATPGYSDAAPGYSGAAPGDAGATPGDAELESAQAEDRRARPFWTPGLISLKGGDLDGDLGREVRALPSDAHLERWDLKSLYPKSDFAGKYILHVGRVEGAAIKAREG